MINKLLVTAGEEGIWWDSYFDYNKLGEVVLTNPTVLEWVKTTEFLYLLVVISCVAVWIFWRKKNGNNIIPKPKKENVWGWVRYIMELIEKKKNRRK